MNKIQKGFTLIELMIVVAIIGILAAVAIPAYQDYIVKAKLSKVQASIGPIKTALALYYQENGGFPNEDATAYTDTLWDSIGLPDGPTDTPEITHIDINGTAETSVIMQLTMGSTIKALTINGLKIDIVGTAGSTAIVWSTGDGANNCSAATDPVTDPVAIKYFDCK